MSSEALLHALNLDYKQKNLSDKINGGEFIPLELWDENNLMEDLKNSETNLKQDITEFEDELTSFNLGADKHLVLDKSITHMKQTNITSTSSQSSYSFTIPHDAEYISDLSLIIEYDGLELDLETRFNLLKSQIKLDIGGNINCEFSLSTNLLICLLRNKQIIEEQGYIKIPLCLLDSPDDNLFPIICLCYHQVRVLVESCVKLKMTLSYTSYYLYIPVDLASYGHINFGELLNGAYTVTKDRGKERSNIIKGQYEYILIQSNNYTLNNGKTNFNGLVKFIMFTFTPKKASTIWDYLDLQPNIDKIYMSLNGLKPMIFEEETILIVEFMGIKLFVIPLCPDMSDWVKIKDNLNNKKFKSTGVNFSKINKINFDFISNIPIDEYDVICTPINLNRQRIMQGMCGTAYSW